MGTATPADQPPISLAEAQTAAVLAWNNAELIGWTDETITALAHADNVVTALESSAVAEFRAEAAFRQREQQLATAVEQDKAKRAAKRQAQFEAERTKKRSAFRAAAAARYLAEHPRPTTRLGQHIAIYAGTSSADKLVAWNTLGKHQKQAVFKELSKYTRTVESVLFDAKDALLQRCKRFIAVEIAFNDFMPVPVQQIIDLIQQNESPLAIVDFRQEDDAVYAYSARTIARAAKEIPVRISYKMIDGKRVNCWSIVPGQLKRLDLEYSRDPMSKSGHAVCSLGLALPHLEDLE